MGSIEGEEYVKWVASVIRKNERKLSQGLHQRVSPNSTSALAGVSLLPGATFFGGWGGSQDQSPSTSPRSRGSSLGLDPHHLYYLLLRCEELGIDVGPLDLEAPVSYSIPARSETRSGRRNEDAISLSSSSVTSSMSKFSLGEPSSWLGFGAATKEKSGVDAELKYVYASMTKIPSLSLTSHVLVNGQFVKGFEDTPYKLEDRGSSRPGLGGSKKGSHGLAVPLYCFKNCTELQLQSLNPGLFVGWDGLSEQLTSLSLHDCGIDDLEEIIIDAVRQDMNRRRMHAGRTDRGSSGPSGSAFTSTATLSKGTGDGLDPSITLPATKWRFLRHLDLHNSALTFIPTRALSYLPSLTHLDLSSNLLVSIPSGLALLSSLRSLNLRDNMIDSVLGIFKVLGNVSVINLAHNRLDNLCGFERLYSIERLDLRSNRITDIVELNRLKGLPSLAELWIGENPFTRYKKEYRVDLFNMFAQAGLSIQLDGSPPTLVERQKIQAVRKPRDVTLSRERLRRGNSARDEQLGRDDSKASKTASASEPTTDDQTVDPSSPLEPQSPQRKIVSKSRARRRHVVFEEDTKPEGEGVNAGGNWTSSTAVAKSTSSGNEYRQRMERLREEQGDNWLHALNNHVDHVQ